MPLLDHLRTMDDVQKAVETDLNGKLIDVKGDLDGEPVGALVGYVQAHLDQVGVNLGLGNLSAVHVAGAELNLVSVVQGQAVVSAFLGPQQAAAQISQNIRSAVGAADGQA